MQWRAKWITARPSEAEPRRMPMFRKSFSVGRIRSARAYVCGLGHFELRINGRKAGEDVLEPGWTNYDKRVLYVTHDVASLIGPGENIIEVLLGNGMYNVAGGRYTKFKRSFGPPMLWLQLAITLVDGGEFEIVSDESWQMGPGPITFSCIYGGEDYDARLESPTDWSPVDVAGGPAGLMQLQTSPPMRVMQSFKGRPISEGVYDCGQNLSGWPIVGVHGEAGATVKLTTGELLDDAGQVGQKNTGKPVTFSYTLRGGEDETWQPRFSLTGFRYVQVETTGNVAIESVGSQWVYAAAPVAGKFECSNQQFNRIHRLILAAIRSNLHSVLTDCPHREKLGWLEQVHLMGRSIVANFDLSSYFPKILADMREAQHENGMVPTIAPQYTSFKPPWDIFNDSPEWGSSMVLVPWLAYTQYGDRQVLADNYDAMRRYAGYLTSRATDHLIDYGLGDWYDIGPGDPGFSKLTSKKLTATAIYYQDLQALAQAAAVLGHEDDANRYAALAEQVKIAFNASLFDVEGGCYDTGSQTAQAMPLALGMVPAAHRERVLQRLIDDIRSRDNHITAGDIGFPYVLQALSAAGRSDVIADLLMRDDPPSYGSQLARGATSLTESWDANPKNSQNHLMLGHAEQWFYESLGGISFDLTHKPCAIRIAPALVEGVDWIYVARLCTFGTIVVHIKAEPTEVLCHVRVPDGAEAELVRIGSAQSERITAGTHSRRWPRA
jgi:hypothetical protein